MDGPSQSLSPSQKMRSRPPGGFFNFRLWSRVSAAPRGEALRGMTNLPLDSDEMSSNVGCRQHIQFSRFLYLLAGVVLRPPSLQPQWLINWIEHFHEAGPADFAKGEYRHWH